MCGCRRKTCHLLEIADAQITALDVSEQRLSRIKENLVRLGLRADLIAADASHTDSWWDQKPFDAVLLDLPCSATGVIRRNPDVRLMRSEASLKSLVGMQSMILDATWETLKIKGRFLVTTCSILPQENEHQIRKFLDRHSDAALVQIEDVLESVHHLESRIFLYIPGEMASFTRFWLNQNPPTVGYRLENHYPRRRAGWRYLSGKSGFRSQRHHSSGH